MRCLCFSNEYLQHESLAFSKTGMWMNVWTKGLSSLQARPIWRATGPRAGWRLGHSFARKLQGNADNGRTWCGDWQRDGQTLGSPWPQQALWSQLWLQQQHDLPTCAVVARSGAEAWPLRDASSCWHLCTGCFPHWWIPRGTLVWGPAEVLRQSSGHCGLWHCSDLCLCHGCRGEILPQRRLDWTDGPWARWPWLRSFEACQGFWEHEECLGICIGFVCSWTAVVVFVLSGWLLSRAWKTSRRVEATLSDVVRSAQILK